MANDFQIKTLVFLLVSIFLAGSIINFLYSFGYLRASLVRESSTLQAGKFIQDNTPVESALLVVGADWSSAFSYHSERRSLALPYWQKVYKSPREALDKSDEWLGGSHLGAIVERVDLKELSKQFICQPKVEQKFGPWRVSICS